MINGTSALKLNPDPLYWLAEQGGRFVRIPARSKAPQEDEWQHKPLAVDEADAHARSGGNVGLLVGEYSEGLCAFDLDEDFAGFLQMFPELQAAPVIHRPDAPERGKVLVRVQGEIPPPKKWKPHPRKPPAAEWLATGNQALVPPSLHPAGTRFELVNQGRGVPILSADEVDRIWYKWTRTHLLEKEEKPKKERQAGQGSDEWERAKDDIRNRFDMTKYACEVLGTSFQRENADENRVLGQGGLLINHRKGVWNTFGEDGTGKVGGDCFSLVAYLKHGDTDVTGDRWMDVLTEAAAYANVALPEKKNDLNDEPPPWAYDAWGHDGNTNGHKPAVKIYSLADLWDLQAGVQKAWGGWMLLNNITLVGGVPNVGKSPLLWWLVRCYLKGEWPDGSPVPPEMAGRAVVAVLPEGFVEQTEMLLAWGLSRKEINERIKVVTLTTETGEAQYQFKLDQHGGLQALYAYCEAVNPGMILVDGLRAAMVGEESSSTDCDRFYGPLMPLAAKHTAAMMLSHHLVKGSEGASHEGTFPSLDWFRGSGELTAKPRSCWIVDQPNQDDMELRRVTLVKAAAGPKNQMMAFRMGDPALGIHWLDAVPPPPPKNKQEIAERFILQFLRQGKASHLDILAECGRELPDISPSTCKIARVGLANRGAIIEVRDAENRHFWALPTFAHQDEEEDPF